MSNAPKTLILCAVVALTAACGGSDTRQTQAQSLLDQAREAVAAKNYDTAFARLDTLDKSYRDCLDQRRAGTRLRSEAIRDLTLDSIGANDALLTRLQQQVDASMRDFRHVDVAGTQGYDVYAADMARWDLNKTGLQARVDPDGYFFMVVNLAGRTVGLCGIEAAGATASGRSTAVEGSEIMNIGQEAARPLAEALQGAQAPVKVTLRGSRGTSSLNLDAKALAALQATWRYAQARQDLRLNLIRRERLERRLSTARDILANLPDSIPAR